jgi:hypothetical protein
MSLSFRALPFAPAIWLGSVMFATLSAQAPVPGQVPPRATSQPIQFAPSGDCLACHNNLTSPVGEDISIGASWRGTIMGNSGRDPYFHASVRRETIDHASRAADIEDECATCHMPAAQKLAKAGGGTGQVFAHLPVREKAGQSDRSALAADGVSCSVCHQIAPDRLGTRESFNGNFTVAPPLPDGTPRAFGPFAVDNGRRRIMHSVSGFGQAEATHIRESELCATCHTLITEALGPDGRVIGSLPEQMNYQEWRHSAFFGEKRSCQSCHMPLVEGPVRVASVLGDYRESLSRHLFVGGNAFMLRLLNRYRAELGVEATPAELEATARATTRQIERDTATVSIDAASVSQGVLSVDVAVRNLTGHKFPTGYPSRRAWLHLTARDASGRVVFESGRVTERGAIVGNASDANATAFEPHYATITAEDQVQIYESIMGTPDGVPTTGLLQATAYLKDSRLLPRGFDKGTAPAEIAVIGAAAADPDFTGNGDRVRYRIALPSAGPVTVEVELRYQPIGYRWAQNLATYKAAEPQTFVGYYNTLASSSSLVVGKAERRVE